MKKIIITFIISISSIAHACSGYIIGFRGKDNQFDQQAFNLYADRVGYCSNAYNWQQYKDAIKLIKTLSVPYQLYGYSQGAVTVANLLKIKDLTKPEFVITIGAYRTTDVNFDRYKIKYINYFDNSGRGQRSPGIFLNVPHSEIQREVNNFFNKGD